MSAKPTVVIGLLGTTLDTGASPDRWERWRPSVAICQHDHFSISRFELLRGTRYEPLARTVVQDIAAVSPETVVREHIVDFTDPWDFEEVYAALHDFARGYPFDTDREDYLVHITTGTHVAQICLFLLTEARHIPGRLLQSSPPPRRAGPVPGEIRIIDLDLSKYDRLAARFQRERSDAVSTLKGGIQTRNAAFNRLIERIEHVAGQSDDPILLMGPTGAGKSQLARRIYDLKHARRRLTGAFVEVNCATLRGDAAMSALFGHKKGAFTGAVQDRPGLLRAADGGLLFLDEVGELGLDEQTMLLRALEDKRFLPLGSDREVQSDFQLICGTNRDLLGDVREGRFRQDLLARIDLWTFRLPALRDRPEDIEPNLEYELEQHERRTGQRVRFSAEARARFLEFAASPRATWAANFRDLGAAVTRMATLSPGGRITVECVEDEIRRLLHSWERADAAQTGAAADESLLREVLGPEAAADLDRFDAVQLAEVIRICRACPTLSEAGRRLFATSRRRKTSANDADRLRKYLARFGLTFASLAPPKRG
jgi:transcriptional regulatory protein RtcR